MHSINGCLCRDFHILLSATRVPDMCHLSGLPPSLHSKFFLSILLFLLSPASIKLYALALHLECWLITPARPGRMSNKMGSLFLRNRTIPKHYLLPRELATKTYYTSYTDILCILYYLRKQCDWTIELNITGMLPSITFDRKFEANFLKSCPVFSRNGNFHFVLKFPKPCTKLARNWHKTSFRTK